MYKFTFSLNNSRFNGKDLTNLNSEQKNKFRRNNYGFIYQNYNLLENFNAIENVALPLILNGYSKDEATQRAENIMNVFISYFFIRGSNHASISSTINDVGAIKTCYYDISKTSCRYSIICCSNCISGIN